MNYEDQTSVPDFLEVSLVAEKLSNIEQINEQCKGEKGEKVVSARLRQLGYARILVAIYHKDPFYLVQANAELGFAYLNMKYIPQAEEHLTTAFKMNEPLTEIDDKEKKEFQIKISVNLAKCYFEKGEINKALKMSHQNLEQNQLLFGKDHISNVDIYYIIANCNTKLENYQEAIENFRIIYDIYEANYGYDLDKTAKVCLEMAQVYKLWNCLNDAIEKYLNAYNIWDKIITDDNYEVMFQIAINVADLYTKINKNENAYQILCDTDKKYSDKMERAPKQQFIFQKMRIKTCLCLKDIDLYLEENLKLEEILKKYQNKQKILAKTCISIGYIYLEKNNKKKCLEYLRTAEEIFDLNGEKNAKEDIRKRIIEIEKKPDNEEEEEEKDDSFDKIYQEEK